MACMRRIFWGDQSLPSVTVTCPFLYRLLSNDWRKKPAHEQWGMGVWKEYMQDFGGKTRTQIRHYIE